MVSMALLLLLSCHPFH
jgi:hypothetical protein